MNGGAAQRWQNWEAGVSKIRKPGWGKRKKTTSHANQDRYAGEKKHIEALELTGTQKNQVIIGLETPSNALGRRNLFRSSFRKSHQGSLLPVDALHYFPSHFFGMPGAEEQMASLWLWNPSSVLTETLTMLRAWGRLLVLWREHFKQNICIVCVGHRLVQLACCFLLLFP